MRLVAGQIIPWGAAGQEAYNTNMVTAGCAILRNDNTSILADVFNNLSNIAFSSWHFDYFSCADRIETTISLPARAVTYRNNGGKGDKDYVVPTTGSADYVLSTVQRTYIPAVIGYSTTSGKVIGASNVYVTGDSFRVLTFSASTSGIVVSEVYYVANHALPAMSMNIVALILDQGLDSTPARNNTNAFKASPSEVIMGSGKIDSSRRYIFKEANNTLGQKMAVAPSIELSVTTSIPLVGGTHPPTTAATRMRAYEDGALIAEVKNAYGSWNSTNGGDWPNVAAPGTTIGIGMP